MFHPNKDQYPHQRVFVVAIGEYAFSSYMETKEEIFLKTVGPAERQQKNTLGVSDEKTQLDKEEQALLAAFESGDLHSARRYCLRKLFQYDQTLMQSRMSTSEM